MKITQLSLGLLLLLPGSTWSSELELKQQTLHAWTAYVQLADSRMKARVSNRQSFLWTDERPGSSQRLRAGQILVMPMVAHGSVSVPDGLIHHWIGAAFLPGATLEDLLTTVHDYNRYKEFYKPIVVESKSLDCMGADQSFSMVWRHKVLFVTDVLDVQYELQDFPVDQRRWYQIADTTRVQEVEDYGGPTEHEISPNRGNGFIWRVHGISRFEQRDGGVYIELEALALTREMPTSMRWLLNPIVARLSRNSLLTSLQQTRDAVRSSGHEPTRLALCTIGSPTAISAAGGGN